MTTKKWYLAGTYEGGCGHTHITASTARRCLLTLRKRGLKGSVYHVRWSAAGFTCRRLTGASR